MRMSFDYPSTACGGTSGLRFLKCSYHKVRESAIFRGDSFAPLEPREEPPLELALPRPLAKGTTTLTYIGRMVGTVGNS